MDILDKIAESHAFMLESHRAFLDLMDELKDERGLGHEDFESPRVEKEIEEEDHLLLSDENDHDENGDGVYDSSDAFPMTQKAFNYQDLDMEDPAFWGGKEIGIPMGLLVHSNDGQGKLLPIKNGLFVDDFGDY